MTYAVVWELIHLSDVIKFALSYLTKCKGKKTQCFSLTNIIVFCKYKQILEFDSVTLKKVGTEAK